MAGHYIEDGQENRGYVEAIPRLYDAVRFTFRPMLPTERAVVMAQAEAGSEVDAVTNAAAVIAGRVIKWDAKRGSGDLVPLDPEHTIRLQPSLQLRIYQMILGNVPSDLDPAEGKNPKLSPADGAKELAAAIAGQQSPTRTQGGREKNSATG